MDPGGGPSKRARRDEEASSGRAEEQTLSESQRMLWDAAQLRQRAAAVQREAEAVAAAAVSRREVAERRLQNARIQAAAAEQRAREDAQLVLQRAQASIDAAAAAAAMEPEGSPARTEAAAAAAAALASVHKKVDAHVAAIKARAEVAYGVKKAEAIIAAAAAEAAAALAGWPAEQRRLLERAERLELQAPLVAELEAQRSSALVQALATSGCLPLIASCLGDAADKLHFALSCKALLRQYRQDQAAWMRGLHVSLACSGSPTSVAACERRLQRLMQRVPHGSISSLSLVQPDRPYAANDMLGLLLSITEHLVQLELQLNDLSTFTAMPVLSWPLLRRAVLHSNGVTSRHSLHWSFGSAPLLESLSLGNGVLRQLPPTLTHLDLFDVFVLEPAVVPLLSGTCLRSMRLRNVELEGNHDFMGMSALTRLTSLNLASVQCSVGVDGTRRGITCALQDIMPVLLKPLSRLACLSLAEARMDALSHLPGSLTHLCLSLRRYGTGTFELSHITRHTALHTLIWAGGPWEVRKQIQSLTRIPNLILL